MVKRLVDLGLKPHHLWLILVLQADRYLDRPPRWYWRELAGFCGRDENTVRRWAYQLCRRGYLSIKRSYVKEDATSRRRLYRNYRNEFDLSPLLAELERRGAPWDEKGNQV